MTKLPVDGILFSVTDDLQVVKCSDFVEKVISIIRSGFMPALVYQINKSLYVRLIRIGNDGFVKKSVVVRSFPCSERTQRSLIMRLPL